MAIIDAASLPWLQAARFTLGLDVTESGFQGFYTGNRQRLSTLSDRLTGTLTLPYCGDASIHGVRESLVMALRSSGDYLRMQMPQRKKNVGTLRYSPTVVSNVLSGARSILLQGAVSSNILLGGSFEFDSNSDGVSDNWTSYTGGSISGASFGRTLFDPSDGVYEQFITATSLGTSVVDFAGIYSTVDFSGEPGAMTTSVRIRGFGQAQAAIQAKCETAGGGAVLAFFEVASATADSTPLRIGGSFVAPLTTRRVTISVLLRQRSGADTARTAAFDAVSLQYGAQSNAWPGRASLVGGDCISVGGNLLVVGPAGAVASDSGLMTVPLALPVPKAISSGAAVLPEGASSLWEWDGDAPQFEYSPGDSQGPIIIPLRQVIT